MLTGLLSCFEGGGLAVLQPGRLGTTPTVHVEMRIVHQKTVYVL